jgi:hypothetical protein
MWADNGWVVVPVEQTHINAAFERDSSHCAIAMAVAEVIADATRIAVDLQTIRFSRKGLRYIFLTPHVAQDRIVAFDQGEREKITPFRLTMRPCQIARAGKRRREVPSDNELRGSGLTVSKYNADGTRNVDPDRCDGLAPKAKERNVALPPLSPKRNRTVSHARKGNVPATLGGKLPPVSILSRREFGLRQLRK